MGLAIDTLTKEKPQNLKLPWKRLFGFAYKLKLRFVVAAIAGVIGTAASVAFPILIGQGISGVVESKNTDALNLLALGLMGVFFIQAVTSYFQFHFVAYIGEMVVYRIRRTLYKKLISSDAPFYSRHKSGELSSRLSSDTTTLQTIFATVLPDALVSILTLVGTVVLILILTGRPSLSGSHAEQ